MKKKMVSTLKILTSAAYIFGVAFLVAGLVLGAVAKPAAASYRADQGGGHCAPAGSDVYKDTSPRDTNTYNPPNGKIITSVWVKSGSEQQEGEGCHPFSPPGGTFYINDVACYIVSWSGSSVTVNRVSAISECHAISHVELVYGPGENPTPTNTAVPPTATFTPETPKDTNTPTPETPKDTSTPTPEVPGATPTNTVVVPTSTSTDVPPTATSTDVPPTATATPNTPPGSTPTATLVTDPTATKTSVPPTSTPNPTLPPSVNPTLPPPNTVSTPVLVPLTGADLTTTTGFKTIFLNLGFAMLGLALVFHGIYLKITRG